MKVTITEIAKEAKVSIATVSRVLNNKSKGVSIETRNRILKIIEEKGYHPNAIARGLVTKKTKVIGLILPSITNPFFPEIERGIEDMATTLGYNIILCNTDYDKEREKKYLKLLIERQVDGIIYALSVERKNYESIDTLDKRGIPFVVFDKYVKNKDVPYIYTENEEAIYNMVKYVTEKGHKNIAYISGPLDYITARDRLRGYKKGLKCANIEEDSSLIKYGPYSIEGGEIGVESLLKENKNFTAIVCANDLIAIGALKALRKHKINVPEDVSITGFDNIDITEVTCPRITTVNQPKYEIGRMAVKMLIDLINGEKLENVSVVLKSDIVEKDSVKDIREELL
ncbi:LacI family DNA-binding transcriptional regulator [Hathewaya histolytica]|uniref:Transcriptional regulator n=1 Tax=Hathewaya histolytica TaxID=1498 RepID=A0A4U9QZB2_HATHI|nr:LacI family DNA-binding transcriptional regulator [Hathewaya histolytica]VTQ82913.1 transcriptional regulator [Hathewaya histolytica]